MASTKEKAAHDEADVSEERARPSSHTRFKSPRVGGSDPHAPSTLPPPPFENEAEIPRLEWWLTAHMGLASELLWLAQLLDGLPEGGSHAGTMLRLVSHVEAVRDALYELYCDAADERMATLLGPDAVLETRVRLSYAWSTRVVGVLAAITSSLRARGEAGPDWAAARTGFRLAEGFYPHPSSELREAVASLALDCGSPIEPLRNLPQDLERLFATIEELHTTLAKRFG